MVPSKLSRKDSGFGTGNIDQEVVAVPSLQIFKDMLDRAWSTCSSGRCPVYGERVGSRWFLRFLSIQTIL